MFDSVPHQRKFISLASSHKLQLCIVGVDYPISVRADKPRGAEGKKASSFPSKFVGIVLPSIRQALADDDSINIAITPYQKIAGSSEKRVRQIYRESRASFIRNTLVELNIEGDAIKSAMVVMQGFTQAVREPLVAKVVDILRAAQETPFPIDVSADFLASTCATPTRQRTTAAVGSGSTAAPSTALTANADGAPSAGGVSTVASVASTAPAPVTPGVDDDMNVDSRAAAKRRLEFDNDLDAALANDEPQVVSEVHNIA